MNYCKQHAEEYAERYNNNERRRNSMYVVREEKS
jgi:hypothetical protein